MHFKIQELLRKRNIVDTTTLTPEEKKDIERWDKVLSEGELTVDKIRQFCEMQVSVIEEKWRDSATPKEVRERLIDRHVVYKALIRAMVAPQSERESTERYLQSLIDAA